MIRQKEGKPSFCFLRAKKGLGTPIILSFHFIAPTFIDDFKG